MVGLPAYFLIAPSGGGPLTSGFAGDPFQQPVNHAGFPNDSNLNEILTTIAGELDLPDLTLTLNNELT